MKTLRLKLISLIAMVCLVLGLVVVGICAAEIQYIKLGGNVVFDIGDKTLYLQDVLIKGNDSDSAYSLKDKGKFVPGYVEEQFSMNLGEYSNNNNSFEIYYDIINTVDEEGNTYVYGVNATSTQEGVTFDYSIDNEYGVILNGSFGPGEITPETPATSRLTFTVKAPTETVVDLNQITITFTDPVYHDFIFTTDDQTGTATLDSYTGNASEVIIPNTISVLTINDKTLYLKGNQYDVTAIRDGSSDTDGVFYNNRANLTSVTLPEKIQSIGAYAFYSCSGLTSITLPESITSIGNRAFSNCDGLTSITLPESITSIGDYAFYNCSSLIEINYNIPSLSDLRNNNYVFAYVGQNGTGVTVNFGDNVESVPAYLFERCSRLTTINFSENMQTIGVYAFYYCNGLTSITLPESITSIGDYAFYNCQYLTEINYNIPSLSSLGSDNFVFGNAGRYGTGITVNFGDSVEHVPAYLFCPEITFLSYYPNIVEVNLSSSIISIGNDSFYNCHNIQTVNYPGTMSQWCTINFAHRYSNPAYYTTSLVIDGEEVPENFILPEEVTSIGAYSFTGYRKLKSVTLPESITSIGNHAFDNCDYLTEINYNIPSLSGLSSNNFVFGNAGRYGTGITVNFGEKVENVPAYLFYPQNNGSTYSPNITEVNFSSSITSIGNDAFAYCTSLTTIDLSNCTNMDTIGAAVFYNCTNLNSVVINEYVFSNVTSSSSSCGYILAYLQSGEGTVYVPEAIINELGHTNDYLNSSFTLQSDTAVDGYYIYVKN